MTHFIENTLNFKMNVKILKFSTALILNDFFKTTNITKFLKKLKIFLKLFRNNS